MGAGISLLVIECIELAVEAAADAAITVAQVTAEVLSETAADALDAVGNVLDGLDTFASQTWTENLADLSTAASDAINGAVDSLQAQLDAIMDAVTNPSEAWQSFVDSLSGDSSISESDATNAIGQMRRAIATVCNLAADAQTVVDASESVMGDTVGFLDLTAQIHDCGISSTEQDILRTQLTSMKNSISLINNFNAVDAGKAQLQIAAKSLASAVFKKALMRQLGSAGGSCATVGLNAQDTEEKTKAVANEVANSGKDVKTILGHVGHAKSCSLLDTNDDKTLKCPSKSKNVLVHPSRCSRRRELQTNASTSFATPGYLFPVRMLCGTGGFREVNSVSDARLCYETVLRETHIDWRHSPFFSHVRNDTSCSTVLFAGTTDPSDAFCTVTRSPDPTPSFTVDRRGVRTYYFDRVHCRSLDEAVHTLLTAWSDDYAEFPLVRFIHQAEGVACGRRVLRHNTVLLDRPATHLGIPTIATFAGENGALSEMRHDLDTVSVLTITLVVLGGVHLAVVMFALVGRWWKTCGTRRVLHPTPPPSSTQLAPARVMRTPVG